MGDFELMSVAQIRFLSKNTEKSYYRIIVFLARSEERYEILC